MKKNSEEKDLLYLQIFGSIIFIITIIVSIILTYNNIERMDKKKPLFNQKQENNISLTNRLIITTIATIFTYISYKFYEINKEKNDKISKKELIASIFALISSLILLKTTIENIKRKSGDNDINIPII